MVHKNNKLMRKFLICFCISILPTISLIAQTSDFVTTLVLTIYCNKNFYPCIDFLDYSNLKLINKNNENCNFIGNLNNIHVKSDSIRITSQENHSNNNKLIEINQYYSNNDSANVEFEYFIKSITNDFDKDLKYCRYTISKSSYLYNGVNLSFCLIKLLYFEESINVIVYKEKNNFVLSTMIEY
jgi:hypothetical protein